MLLVNAVDLAWEGAVTQLPRSVFACGIALEDMGHEPLGFVGGSFRGAQVRWPTADRLCFDRRVSNIQVFAIRRVRHAWTIEPSIHLSRPGDGGGDIEDTCPTAERVEYLPQSIPGHGTAHRRRKTR